MMGRFSIYTFGLLTVVLVLCMSQTLAVVDSDELIGLKAIRDAFPALNVSNSISRKWTDVALATACTSTSSNPTGITCSSVPGQGIRPTAITISASAAFMNNVNSAEVALLRNVKSLIFTISATSTIKTYDGFLSMTNLTALTVSFTTATGNLTTSGSLSALTNLETLTFTSTYGFSGWPDFNGVTKLKQLTLITTYATYPTRTGIEMPVDLFEGMSSLTYLSISSNAAYPWLVVPDLSAQTGLVELHLSCGIETLPDYFGSLSNLTILDVSSNPQLNKLPASLANCTKLTTLQADDSRLNLDDSFFDMSNTRISQISLRRNLMTVFPTSLCNLPTNASVPPVTFFLDTNRFESLPACLANKNINSMIMFLTNFATFPTVLTQIPSLTTLSLRSNSQRMTGDADFSNSPNFVAIELVNSNWYAAFPASLSNSVSLYSFAAEGNQFQGTIPDNFFVNLSTLSTFDVTGSSLTGTFPTSVGSARALNILYAAGNRFSRLTDHVVNASNIAYLDFSDNRLVAAPNDTVWSQMPRLRYFMIGGNTELTGLLPTWWSQGTIAPNLYTLNMSYTGYYGHFPVFNNSYTRNVYISGAGLNGQILGFEKATNLQDLRLDRNALTGPIPNSIGVTGSGALSLGYLDLSYNRLSGDLPTYFTALGSLSALIINNNGFTGPLPNIALMNQLSYLHVQNNFFDLCYANPGIPSRLNNNCNATNQAIPNACGCAQFFTYCAVNTTCPAPDYVPVQAGPYSVPVPIKPPTTTPTPEPVWTPSATPTDTPTVNPSGNPSATPSITPSASPTGASGPNSPTGAASSLAASIALLFCATLSLALLL